MNEWTHCVQQVAWFAREGLLLRSTRHYCRTPAMKRSIVRQCQPLRSASSACSTSVAVQPEPSECRMGHWYPETKKSTLKLNVQIVKQQRNVRKSNFCVIPFPTLARLSGALSASWSSMRSCVVRLSLRSITVNVSLRQCSHGIGEKEQRQVPGVRATLQWCPASPRTTVVETSTSTCAVANLSTTLEPLQTKQERDTSGVEPAREWIKSWQKMRCLTFYLSCRCLLPRTCFSYWRWTRVDTHFQTTTHCCEVTLERAGDPMPKIQGHRRSLVHKNPEESCSTKHWRLQQIRSKGTHSEWHEVEMAGHRLQSKYRK